MDFNGAANTGYLSGAVWSERSRNLNQPRTVSLRDINNEDSTSYPTNHRQIPPDDEEPPNTDSPRFFNWLFDGAALPDTSASIPTNSAQSVAPPLQQFIGNAQYPAESSTAAAQTPEQPIKHGRGYTGNPRGRPTGAKNKPKVPDDGLPKLPKKRGRPLGAKNKNPRGAHGVNTSAPDGGSSSIDGQHAFAPTSSMAADPSVTLPPAAPAGYALATSFSQTLDPTTLMSPSDSPPTFPNLVGYGQPAYAQAYQEPPPAEDDFPYGHRYPSPSIYENIFGTGNEYYANFDNSDHLWEPGPSSASTSATLASTQAPPMDTTRPGFYDPSLPPMGTEVPLDFPLTPAALEPFDGQPSNLNDSNRDHSDDWMGIENVDFDIDWQNDAYWQGS